MDIAVRRIASEYSSTTAAPPEEVAPPAVTAVLAAARITDPEVMEARFPVRLHEFSIRQGSGGAGAKPGGEGVIREWEALEPLTMSIISERRRQGAFGIRGGAPGAVGENLVNGKPISGRESVELAPGDRVRIVTPGGGGYGPPAS